MGIEDQPNVFHFIIPNADSTRILVGGSTNVPGSNIVFRLPSISPPKGDGDTPWVNSWNGETDDLCKVVSDLLGLRIYARDLVWVNPDVPSGCEEAIIIADLLGPCADPSSDYWIPLEQVSKVSWEHIHSQVDIPKLVFGVLSATVDSCCNTRPMDTQDECVGAEQSISHGPVHRQIPTLPLWRRPGWFADIERWFISTINEKSLQVRPGGFLTQARNMYYSTVLKCPVEVGSDSDISSFNGCFPAREFYVFLKCSCLNFHEALMTNAIAFHLPEFVPKVLAIRDECTFIQVGAFDKFDISPSSIMQALADMQLRSLSCLDALQSDGIPYRGLDWHARHITNMLQRPALTSLQTKQPYTELHRRIDDFRTLLAELSTYRIPQTLIHGDFNELNILVRSFEHDSVVFIDWATACISHPFIDFLRITDVEFERIDDEISKEMYLRCWREYESAENIARALRLAYPVLLCENLFILLEMYEAANSMERQHLIPMLESRLMGISDAVDSCLRERFGDFGDTDGVGLLIISKDNGRLVLAQQSDQCLSLPVIGAFEINGHAATDRQLDGHGFRQMIRSHLELDTRVVRTLFLQLDEKPALRKVAVVLEVLDRDHQIPPGYIWVSANDVKCFNDGHREEEKVMAAFFEGEGAQYVKNDHTPWRQLGWFTHICKWVDDTLKHRNLRRNSSLDEVKSNALSSVWRCTFKLTKEREGHGTLDSVETVFMKAGIGIETERQLLKVVSRFAKGSVPSVIDADPNPGAVLLTDMGQANQDDLDWFLVFKGLAEVQTRSVEYLDELQETGLQRYDCRWLIHNARRLLKDCTLSNKGEEGSHIMPQPVIEADDVIHCAEELESFNMPLALVHGDFHLGNVGKRKQDGGYGIFDWSSAFVGYPLCDFAVMTKTPQRANVNSEDSQKGYLCSWGESLLKIPFHRAVDLCLVYYWVVNLEVLVQLSKKVPIADKALMEKHIAHSMKCVAAAVESVKQNEKKDMDAFA